MEFNEWLMFNKNDLIFLIPTQPLQKISFIKALRDEREKVISLSQCCDSQKSKSF